MGSIIHCPDTEYENEVNSNIRRGVCGKLVYPEGSPHDSIGYVQNVNCEDCLKTMKRNRLINDAAPGWDDRKHVLDIYYANGGKYPGDLPMEKMYEGLLAVARYSAERMYDWLEEEKEL